MAIIETTDFTGRYKIPLNPKQDTELTDMITYVENKYLPTLFGVELYDLFIADLTVATPQIPQTARFTKVFDPFNYQENSSCIYSSEGIREVLKGLTYFHYLRDIGVGPNTTGFNKADSENSTVISALAAGVTSRYNQGIDTYKIIQFYMYSADSATYPEFDGMDQEYTQPF